MGHLYEPSVLAGHFSNQKKERENPVIPRRQLVHSIAHPTGIQKRGNRNGAGLDNGETETEGRKDRGVGSYDIYTIHGCYGKGRSMNLMNLTYPQLRNHSDETDKNGVFKPFLGFITWICLRIGIPWDENDHEAYHQSFHCMFVILQCFFISTKIYVFFYIP